MMRTEKMKGKEPESKEREALHDLSFSIDYLAQTEHLMDCGLIVEGRAYEVVQAWKRYQAIRGEK